MTQGWTKKPGGRRVNNSRLLVELFYRSETR